jgi:hypothetical protein
MSSYNTPNTDYLDLARTTYESQLQSDYELIQSLKNMVTVNTDVMGVDHKVGIMGRSKGYERIGSNMVTPTDFYTAETLLTYKNWENIHYHPKTRSYELSDLNVVSALTHDVAASLNAFVEMKISQAVYDVATIKSKAWNASDNSLITKSMQIMGDGSDQAGGSLAAGDIKPFDLGGLRRLAIIKNQLGIQNNELIVVATPGMLNALLQIDQFVNSRYVNDYYPLTKVVDVYSWMGLLIIPAQANVYDSTVAGTSLFGYASICGLKTDSVSSTPYVISYAFPKDAILLKSDSVIAETGWEYRNNSWYFKGNVRAGSAVVAPNKVIQIVTSSIS